MSLYNLAEKDAKALKEARMQDPYAGDSDTLVKGQETDDGFSKDNFYTPSHSYQSSNIHDYQDPNEVKVQKKLDELEKVLNTNNTDMGLSLEKEKQGQPNLKDTEMNYAPFAKMMANIPNQHEPDPELEQLNGMLEKILDIQHPGRMSKQIKAQSEKEAGRVFPVTTAIDNDNALLLERPYISPLPDDSGLSIASGMQQNAFYDAADPVSQENISHQTIPAIIPETQTLVSGATVKLRLAEDVYIDGRLIPKNTLVSGICQVSGERLNIQVKTLRHDHAIFPVSLSVYDMDGIEGIRVPGAITRDAAKQSSGQALQSLQLMSLDPSLGEQAAGAGIEAVKGLLSKKAKLIRVTVKAGYPVLLVDKKSMQQ